MEDVLLRSAVNKSDRLCRHRRSGLFDVVVLRELVVISAGLAFVMTILWQASTAFQMHASSQQTSQGPSSPPIIGISMDHEQPSFTSLSWPAELQKTSLESGITVPLNIPRGIVSAVTSSRSATTVLLAEWPEEDQIHHRVDITRRDEVILSEEFKAFFAD